MNKGFVVFSEDWAILQHLSNKQLGELFTALFHVFGAPNCPMPELDQATNVVLHAILPRMKEATAILPDFEEEQRRRILDISQRQWREMRELVFERDRYVCQYCGRQIAHPHCDHVYPLSRGGRSTLDNLVTACPACNCSKHDKTPEEWRSGR